MPGLLLGGGGALQAGAQHLRRRPGACCGLGTDRGFDGELGVPGELPFGRVAGFVLGPPCVPLGLARFRVGDVHGFFQPGGLPGAGTAYRVHGGLGGGDGEHGGLPGRLDGDRLGRAVGVNTVVGMVVGHGDSPEG
ncbi:hypothetical protein [Streptomyces sp. NPDC048442]|uniref:hypothetical protein n=1 Tax=Streptomyces sp. NPDC048442 TaxID=3154823 RepID=UPI0034377376